MNAAAPRITLAPGVRIGDFEVIRLLGTGSFGAVYEALHVSLGQRVALKLLDARYARHPEALARFEREAEANAVSTHPNIVRVYASGVVEGQRYLALECLDGETLAARLARVGIMTATEVADLFVPMLSALSTVHARGFVHRDLKPGNVFLARRDGGESAVLLDFGVVKVSTATSSLRLTRQGQLLGSPSYMSPEQTRSLPIDHRSDQFAVGAMLWECLAGRRLFCGNAVWEVLEAVRQHPVPPLDALRNDLPRGLSELVLRALARAPNDRYSDVITLGVGLLPFASTETRRRWANAFGLAPPTITSVEPEAPTTLVIPPTELFTQRDHADESATHELSPARRDGEPSDDRTKALRRITSVVLGRYRLDALQGLGGVAAVYGATDLRTGEVVAVKLLHPSLSRDRTASARFLRESRVTRWLSHPAIPQWLAGGSDPVFGHVLVMAFVDGVDLGTVVDLGGPLPVTTALLLCARTAEALESAHAAGVVHRDVKPENLLLVGGVTDPDALRLVDFGLAFCVDATRLTQMNTIDGSACYLSPEQLEGNAVTPASDLYSLGATLVTLLTGSAPYEGDYLQQLAAHASAPPPSLRARRAQIPEVVERYVHRLMEKDPRRRPSSAAEVGRRLAEMAGWFTPDGARPDAPSASIVHEDTPSMLIDEIQRLSERLRQTRASAVAAQGRIVEQMIDLSSRQLHRAAVERDLDALPPTHTLRERLSEELSGLGDSARDAQREAALETALERMQAQSRAEQQRLLATLAELEHRLTSMR